MKYLASLLFILIAFSSCSLGQVPNKQLDKVVILNHTNSDIKNVSIYSYSTKRVMRCSFIPQNAYCSYSFSKNEKSKNIFQIKWSLDNKEYSHEYVTVKNINLSNDSFIRISMNLLPNGKFFIKEF